MRFTRITRNYTKYAEGSVLIETGDTKVLCNVSIEDNVPFFERAKYWMADCRIFFASPFNSQ